MNRRETLTVVLIKPVIQFPKPVMDLLDINLNGCLYFARIALAYLKDGSDNLRPPTKSIVFISSAAAFQEGPGLCGYTASKAGIIGLMRSLRSLTPENCNARVNVISPWATDTTMIAAHVHLFKENNIPLNTADDVALYTQYVATDSRLNGRNVYVGGGKGFDIEEGLEKTLPQWLGQESLDGWRIQDKVFGQVSS